MARLVTEQDEDGQRAFALVIYDVKGRLHVLARGYRKLKQAVRKQRQLRQARVRQQLLARAEAQVQE
jgi:hypothetical protein